MAVKKYFRLPTSTLNDDGAIFKTVPYADQACEWIIRLDFFRAP